MNYDLIGDIHGHSAGGDSDTLAAITGSIAEANWGVPVEIRREALERTDDGLLETYQQIN